MSDSDMTLQNGHVYLTFQRSHSFLFIHTLMYRQNIKTYASTKNLVYRQRGHCKCLHTSNCLLTKPLKIGQWVYTWIHFSAAAPRALLEHWYWLRDVDPMVRQRHKADEQAQCSNGQPSHGESPTTLGSSIHLLIKGDTSR